MNCSSESRRGSDGESETVSLQFVYDFNTGRRDKLIFFVFLLLCASLILTVSISPSVIPLGDSSDGWNVQVQKL